MNKKKNEKTTAEFEYFPPEFVLIVFVLNSDCLLFNGHNFSIF